MVLSIDQIERLYRSGGAALYGGEAVDQQQHAFQCAQLAEASGASAELVAAALLHDLGHLVAGQSRAVLLDGKHEERAVPYLRGTYPEAVVQPIRLHVAAKRFLCATEPAYRDSLSLASRRSLDLQGGPFSPHEVEQFLAQPYAWDAIEVRRWDEQAKDPRRATPGWGHYREVLELVQLRTGAAAG